MVWLFGLKLSDLATVGEGKNTPYGLTPALSRGRGCLEDYIGRFAPIIAPFYASPLSILERGQG